MENMKERTYQDNTKTEVERIVELILNVIPLAMGVAVATLAVLGEIDAISALPLVGIGVACLGVKAINTGKE